MENSWIEINNYKLEIKRIKAKKVGGPTLVFLHEGLGCVSMWRDFPDRLAEKTGLVALIYSRLGYGGSDQVPLPRQLDYMHVEGIDILPALLQAEQVGRVILVGHSDGGSISLIYAGSKFALELDALIMIAPHVFVEKVCIESIKKVQREYLFGDLRKRLERYHKENVDRVFWGWSNIWVSPSFQEWNIEEYLPFICAPTLVVQGENDQFGTMSQINSIIEKIKLEVNCEVVKNCSHSPHIESQDEVIHVLSGFINKLL